MAVTDLTNTIWLFNDTVDLEDAELIDFGLNFKSNNVTYDTFSFSPGRTSTFIYYSVSPDRTQAYSTSTGWANTNYKVISITGGYDATNSHLISWLTNNATLLPSDLTGYTWVGNNTLSFTSTFNYSINFNSNNESFTSFACTQFGRVDILSYNDVMAYASSWDYDYKTIEITGGLDATNPTLIAWLQNNGTLAVPQPTVNTYEITHTLTNLTKGNITLQITPDNGYTYPTSLTISNGTIVSYDNTTGIAIISGDDTTIVSGECVAQPSGFEVELYGWDGAGETVYVQINDDPTWYYAEMIPTLGFATDHTNIPNVYEKTARQSIGIPNVSKIKIGTEGNPTQYTGPQYVAGSSTGDFANLTFTSTGGSAPAYATGEITMTQDSKVYFHGDD